MKKRNKHSFSLMVIASIFCLMLVTTSASYAKHSNHFHLDASICGSSPQAGLVAGFGGSLDLGYTFNKSTISVHNSIIQGGKSWYKYEACAIEYKHNFSADESSFQFYSITSVCPFMTYSTTTALKGETSNTVSRKRSWSPCVGIGTRCKLTERWCISASFRMNAIGVNQVDHSTMTNQSKTIYIPTFSVGLQT